MTTESNTPHTDWVALARELGPRFGSRAAALDESDTFGKENFAELKEKKVFSAAVPADLGGGGASHPELCAMLRELGRHCGGTALALSMHTHLVATNVCRFRQGAPLAPLLQKIAKEELFLVTSNAYDWMESNGKAEKVEGGFRVSARKPFGSGGPAANLFISTAVYDDPTEGPTVLHFAIPMKSEGLTLADNWKTLAMRASGSNDVVLENVFVPDAAVAARRPKGAWSPLYSFVVPIALPIINSVYLGVAEAARDIAIESAAKKKDDADVWYIIGEMENALVNGQIAVQSLVDLCADYTFKPDMTTVNAAFIRKTIAVESLTRAVEKALEVVGGKGVFRTVGLERRLRDIHAAQFHPIQAKRQHKFSGRAALGLDPIKLG